MQETLVWSLRRSPEIGNGNLLQYSCLDDSGDRTAWWAIVHWGCKEQDTTEWLSEWVYMRAHTRTPISLHGPARKLSLLQTLMSWFVWPHELVLSAQVFAVVSIPTCPAFPRVWGTLLLWKLFFPGFWGLQCHSLPWAQEFSTNRGTIQTA